MSMGNFNKYLRQIVRTMYSNGDILDVNYVAGYTLSRQVKELLQLLVQLVMKTDYFKNETKQVLLGESYRNSGATLINTNTVKSRVVYDFGKLSRILGADFFDIVLHKQNIDLSNYTAKINLLLELSKNKSALDILQIKLPECSGKEINDISQEDWMLLLYVLVKYSKCEVHRIEKQLTGNMVDYVKYLENNKSCLNDIQRKHYEILQEFKN